MKTSINHLFHSSAQPNLNNRLHYLVPLKMAAHVEFVVTVQNFTSRLGTLSLPINLDAVLNINLDDIAYIILVCSGDWES